MLLNKRKKRFQSYIIRLTGYGKGDGAGREGREGTLVVRRISRGEVRNSPDKGIRHW